MSGIHKQPIPLPYYCAISNLKIVALLVIPQKRGCPDGLTWMFDRVRDWPFMLNGLENK